MAGSVRREEKVLGLVFKVSLRSATVFFRSFSSYMGYLPLNHPVCIIDIYTNYIVVYYIFGFIDFLTHKK